MRPPPPQTNDKLEQFYSGMRQSMQGPSDNTNLYIFLLIATSVILALIAITNWQKRSSAKNSGMTSGINSGKPPGKSKPQHGKLLKEIGKQVGVPAKQLKAIEPMTQRLGASSPLVALLCPSLLKQLADDAHDEQSRMALSGVARKMVEADGD